jgi:hypothetical protein
MRDLGPIKHHLNRKELVEELQGGIDEFNRRFHRTISTNPTSKFAADPTPIRRVPERLLALSLLPRREGKTIQPAGIQHGMFYRHSRLNRHIGEHVEIAFSEKDASYVHVFLNGEYLCKATTTPSRAMARALKASRQHQFDTFHRIQLGAERLRLERAGLDADDLDLETLRRERKNLRKTVSKPVRPRPPRPRSSHRAAHLKDDTWKPS